MSVARWLPALRPALEGLCAAWAIPLGVPVGWIQVESGGRLAEVTSLGERGYFQLLGDESADLGITHERLSTDSSYSLASGFRLMDYYRRTVQAMRQPSTPGTEYAWRLIKLAHSMGSGALRVVLTEAVTDDAADSWAALSAYATGRDADYLHRLHHSPTKWLGLVDEMFAIGAPYGLDALVCASSGGQVTSA